MKKILLGTLAISLILFSCKGGEKKATEAQQPEQVQQAEPQKPAKLFNTDSLGAEPQFDIVTSMGTIRIKLYEDTPKHKKNFIRLASEGYFDGMQFHRVINNFMIQTGDPYTKYSETEYPQAYQSYGTGGPGYTIPAEIVNTHKHKKGALAAARKGDTSNPEKASSGSQFYIVQSEQSCKQLDGDYTVFGETVKGFEVIDKIAKVPTGARKQDLPNQPVKIISVRPAAD